MFYNRAIRKINKIRDEIREIKKQIQTLPEGSFSCQRNGKYYKWRVTKGKKQMYIARQERKLAEQFALKKYLTCRLANLKNEETAIQAYLDIHNQFVNTKDEELLEHPEYRKLLSPYNINLKEKMQEWMDTPYKSNPHYPEHLIHETTFGLKTRSKAEQMIAEALHQQDVKFHYEEELQLGDTIYYPDFICAHPKTGQFIIWENIGLSDKPDYMFRTINKLQHFFQYGYYPTINLILTFDTKKYPVTAERIDRVMEMYFDC